MTEEKHAFQRCHAMCSLTSVAKLTLGFHLCIFVPMMGWQSLCMTALHTGTSLHSIPLMGSLLMYHRHRCGAYCISPVRLCPLSLLNLQLTHYLAAASPSYDQREMDPGGPNSPSANHTHTCNCTHLLPHQKTTTRRGHPWADAPPSPHVTSLGRLVACPFHTLLLPPCCSRHHSQYYARI